MTSIRVGVVKRPDIPNLVMRFKDAVTGRWTCSTKYVDPTTGAVTKTGTNRKFAERLAAKWEADLNAGRGDLRGSDIGWQQFINRYEDEHLPSLAPRSQEKAHTVIAALELFAPKLANGTLADLTPELISRFQAALRNGKRAEDTIASYIAYLKSMLNWAVAQELLPKAPTIRRPQRVKKGRKAKGRPITGEELDRLIAAVPAALGGEWQKTNREFRRKASRRAGRRAYKTPPIAPVEVSPIAVESWWHLLRGLWLSGLRLGEALQLSWRDGSAFAVDLSGRRPRFRIDGSAQKSGRTELCPMTPDFAEWLLRTPEAERKGRVFNPLMPSGQRANAERSGRMVALLGKLSRVVVDAASGKTASAHDLRRSFGTRWSRKVMPPVLMRLMRHQNIATTMTFYVGLDCDEIADGLWQSSTVSVPFAPVEEDGGGR